MPNLSWPVKSEWFMESPGVKWLRGNRGLQLLEFRVIGGATRACSNCWETNKDKSEQMLEDVQRKICAEVEEVEQ